MAFWIDSKSLALVALTACGSQHARTQTQTTGPTQSQAPSQSQAPTPTPSPSQSQTQAVAPTASQTAAPSVSVPDASVQAPTASGLLTSNAACSTDADCTISNFGSCCSSCEASAYATSKRVLDGRTGICGVIDCALEARVQCGPIVAASHYRATCRAGTCAGVKR